MEFTQEYATHFPSNIDIWTQKLVQIKEFIDANQRTPSRSDRDPEIKILGQWLMNQKKIMKKIAKL